MLGAELGDRMIRIIWGVMNIVIGFLFSWGIVGSEPLAGSALFATGFLLLWPND